MKIDWQILWNVKPICETFKIYYLMGRRLVRDVLGNHSKDRLFHLVHWLSIIVSLRKTSQESINLERKLYLDCFLDTLWNLEGWLIGCRHWGVGNDGRIRNLLEKTQCERGVFSQTRRIYFSSHRWTNQNPWRRSGTEIVFLGTASTNSRRE